MRCSNVHCIRRDLRFLSPISPEVMSIPSLPASFAESTALSTTLLDALGRWEYLPIVTQRLSAMPSPERTDYVGANSSLPTPLTETASPEDCIRWLRQADTRTFWLCMHICRGSEYCKGGALLPSKLKFVNGVSGISLGSKTHTGEEIGERMISKLLRCIPGVTEVRMT